jgi:hypothetical protein
MKTKHLIKRLFKPILILVSASHVSAEPNKNYPTVDDTSYAETNGDHVIQLSALLPAATNEVWQALTTAEGWTSFAVSFASVDMRIGGIIETSYNPKAAVGDPDNIKNQIVAYVPGRILAIRCVQAPRKFEHQQEFTSTVTLFELIPVETNKTRLILTAVGYRPGPAYDDLFTRFRWGNAYTLDKLRLRFESGRSSAPAENGETKSSNKSNVRN